MKTHVPSDLEIAQSTKLKPITEIAKSVGLKEDEIKLETLKRIQNNPQAKYVDVTAITPTPLGEGKTVTTIGASLGLAKINKNVITCIRQPSLGPVFGIKGGAAGGGYSQVLPMEEFNLHLTGDIHNVTAAHNLLTAMIYNHIYQGNDLMLDENRIVWNRVMDMNDRALRGSFSITASSEIMAIMCLSENLTDMKERLSQI